MEFEVRHDGKKSTLKAHGSLTMDDADTFKESLLNCIDSAEEVHIDIEEVEEADLSCLELLCAAHKTAERSEKKVLISGRPSEGLWASLEDAGFFSRTTCEWDNARCLWDEIQKREKQ